jgi:predicted RNA binding protein YcfA (HicA-like mRNA interferase family)
VSRFALGRLRRLSGREVCRILEKNGFAQVRQRGSHVVMQRRSGNTTITVPVPVHAELKAGTLLSIVRQSGVPRAEFEASQ